MGECVYGTRRSLCGSIIHCSSALKLTRSQTTKANDHLWKISCFIYAKQASKLGGLSDKMESLGESSGTL